MYVSKYNRQLLGFVLGTVYNYVCASIFMYVCIFDSLIIMCYVCTWFIIRFVHIIVNYLSVFIGFYQVCRYVYVCMYAIHCNLSM